jgi:hypothetical protein
MTPAKRLHGTAIKQRNKPFIHSTHNSAGTSRRDSLSTTTGDHGSITTRPWLLDATTGSSD